MQLLLIFILFYLLPISSQSNDLKDWHRFSKSSESQTLLQWLHCRLENLSDLDACGKINAQLPLFYGKNGIFITLLQNKKVKGCYGSFYHPSEEPEVVFNTYLRGALLEDPRYSPISDFGTKIYILVTITGLPKPTSNIKQIDLSRYGIMLGSGSDGNTQIFVPKEIKNPEYLYNKVYKEKITEIFYFNAVSIQEK